jgi:hypothetical protein
MLSYLGKIIEQWFSKSTQPQESNQVNSAAATSKPSLELSYQIERENGAADLFGWVNSASIEDAIDQIEARHKLALDDQISWKLSDRKTQRVIASFLNAKEIEKGKLLPLPQPKNQEEKEKDTIGNPIPNRRAIIKGVMNNV